MASLGACPQAGNFDSAEPFVFVNEVTTVAAAYAMAGIATDPTHIAGPGLPTAAGVAYAANLARVSTGKANASLPSDRRTAVPQSKINTLANILAACINTGGPASAGCTTLFANAQGSGTNPLPQETAAAAINIAHNPRANIATLYALQPQVDAPFEPRLGSPPGRFHDHSRGQHPGQFGRLLAFHPVLSSLRSGDTAAYPAARHRRLARQRPEGSGGIGMRGMLSSSMPPHAGSRNSLKFV